MIHDDGLAHAGWHVQALDPSRDGEAVAALFMACPDYALLITGEPPRNSAGDEFFREGPPGHPPDAIARLGIFDPADRLVGVAQVARAYPRPDTWYIGLLLLHPSVRRRGAGREAVRRIDQAAAVAGGARLMLGVVQANRDALSFWRGLGFRVVARKPFRRFGAKEHAVLEMERRVGAGVEEQGLLGRFLDPEGRVTVYPSARKNKQAVLAYLAAKFDPGRQYSEAEVNDLLARHHTFGDWVLLRRDMFETGLLGRTRDGSRYWRVVAQRASDGLDPS